MRQRAKEFVEFALQHEALRFGDFVLKSGRRSPYFFNAGAFCDGPSLERLGQFYADAVVASGLRIDVLFGPAYKGIPIVAATAVCLHRHHRVTVGYCCDRKDEKHYGEGGRTFGAAPHGRVLIVDDVLTAGTSVRNVLERLRPLQAELAGILVALDRRERDAAGEYHADTLTRELGVPLLSIAIIDDILEYLRSRPERREAADAIASYLANSSNAGKTPQ